MRTNILDIAEDLARRHEIRGFICPTNSGTTARETLDRFGRGFEYYAVGNPARSHDLGYVHHSGVAGQTAAELEKLGFEVILQEVSPFQPKGGSPVYFEHARAMQESFARALGHELRIEGSELSWVVETTIRGLFDQQAKTCVEIALIAGTSPAIDPGSRYISLCTASRWSDFRDCAIVLTPSTPATFFQRPPRIAEVAYSDLPAGERPDRSLGGA